MIHEIIDRVRTSRNNKIKEFSERRVVLEYFLKHHGIELSDRKHEFLSRELKELLIAPVDLAHYASVITEFKDSPGKTGLDDHCDRLIMDELTKIFNRYIFY
jgi:hypothetical protein